MSAMTVRLSHNSYSSSVIHADVSYCDSIVFALLKFVSRSPRQLQSHQRAADLTRFMPRSARTDLFQSRSRKLV